MQKVIMRPTWNVVVGTAFLIFMLLLVTTCHRPNEPGKQLISAHELRRESGRYPEDKEALNEMLLAQNVPAMRAHAWAILSALTHSGTRTTPDWEGPHWQGKCRIGLKNSNCPADAPDFSSPSPHIAPFLETAVQLKSTLTPKEAQFQVSSVLFNPSAITFVRKHRLTKDTAWQQLLREHENSRLHNAPRFARNSLVVKEIFEVVEPCDLAFPNCFHHVAVWSDKVKQEYPDVRYPPVPAWSKSVLDVNLDTSIACDRDRIYPIVSVDDHPPLSDEIPINCFHWIPVSPGPKSAFTPRAGNITNKDPAWIPRKQNSYLLLVGFHVASAELPDWVWSTFWWTNQPHNDKKAQDQPVAIADSIPWKFFSMDTTMSMDTPRDATDHGPNIIFNPYLEGAINNGPVSNCLYCHRRAVYRQGTQHAEDDIAKGSPQRCAFTAPDTAGCQPLPPDTDFEDAIRTNFLWSLAIHQDHIANEHFPVFEAK
jgi:hypothetical protein